METTIAIERPRTDKREEETVSPLWRQLEVLGGGFSDGMVMTASNVGNSIKQTASDFTAAPARTAADYVSAHWQDAAVGAAISLIMPRNLASKALTAYALQGVYGSTLRAGCLAANPNVDLKTARAYYADSLSTEATALAKALPATMVGGMAGRATGNAMFGANKGAFDMLPRYEAGRWVPGAVTLDTVSTNLSRLAYKVNPKPVKLVFTDMDNTLLDFSTHMAKGVETGVSNMSAKLKQLGHDIPEKQLYKMIGEQMDIARSHDYPWSVELALSKRLKVGEPGGMTVQQFRSELVEPFWQTIDNSRATHMKLLPGVEHTLQELKRKGIPTVIVSDAPAYAAMQRSVQMGLDKYIDGVYALNNMIEPKGLSPELLAFGRERVANILSTANDFKFFKAVPKQWEKPHTNSFDELLGKYGENGKPLDPRQAIMIGDSRTKDIEGARKTGMVAPWIKGEPANAVWAEFGNPPKHIDEILLRLRNLPEHQSAPGLPKVYATPLENARSYDALLKYINPKPDYRFLTAELGRSLLNKPAVESVYSPLLRQNLSENKHFYQTDKQLVAPFKR